MSTVGPGDRDVLRTAWHALCRDLQATGLRTIDALDDVDNPQELAEALRAVARMALMALQQRMEFDDPDFPSFFRSLDDRYKYGGPDTYITYVSAPVRGSGTYRVHVDHHGRNLQLGRFWAGDLQCDADGGFEILVGAQPQPGNWQPIDPATGEGPHVVPDLYPMATGAFSGRIYYVDPEDARPARLSIERIDPGRPRQPAPLDPARLAAQIDSARELMLAMSTWWFQRATNIRRENEPNVIGPPGTRPPGVPTFHPPAGSPLNYGVCCWEIEPDQALVVTSDLPQVQYWSFQLHTPWWESPDNQHRQTSIAHTHAHLDADGRFRCVLAHRDPGSPNWLDAGGHRRGFLFYRWLRPAGAMPTPEATLVPLARVREHLPAEHPVLDQDARDAQLSARRRWYAARFQS
ncbi:MAG: DUF1214 domain-containing protein [Gammaproteobacteria bacterium]